MRELLQVERDGRALPTTLQVPATEPPWPLVVFAHGWLGHPRKFTRLFGRWTAAGFAVAAPAFPFSNDETPAPDFEDVANQPADLRFVLDRLTDDERFDQQRIGVAGFSLGAIATLALAFGSRPDTRTSAVIAIAGRAPWFVAATPRRCPLLVVHGRRDPVVSYEEGLDFFRLAQLPKALLTIEVAGHHEYVEDEPPTAGEEVVDDVTTAFLDWALRAAPAPPPEVDAGLGHLENAGAWS